MQRRKQSGAIHGGFRMSDTTTFQNERSQNIDSSLAVYFAANQSGVRSLLLSVVSEIERLELIIMQQCQSLESVEQALADIELDTMESIFNESTIGSKQKPVARFSNDHQRRYEQRSRLRKNSSYASLQESRRGMTREKARLSARLHKLEGYRVMLIADL
jgi:hypothetical protein